jgi:thymidine kinase
VAKLYFRFGAVGSAKTMNLLAVAHAYEQQNKRCVLIKPAIDTRFGDELVRSRAGLQRTAEILVHEDTIIDVTFLAGANCILVDEAQFLSPFVVDQLRDIASSRDIPVICYGLRTDFRRNLFPGSKRLLELSDAIEEVKTTCAYCNRKGIFNLKLVSGVPTLAGPTIDLGTEEKYLPTCARCYSAKLAAHYHVDRPSVDELAQAYLS